MSIDTAPDIRSADEIQRPRRLPPTTVAKSIGGMFSDFISLSELQLKLLKRDTAETIQRTYVSAAFFIIGILILIACLPVGMLGIVYVISDLYELGWAASFGIVVASALLIGTISAFIGYLKLKKAGNIFHRSQTELSKNVEWLKSSLRPE